MTADTAQMTAQQEFEQVTGELSAIITGLVRQAREWRQLGYISETRRNQLLSAISGDAAWQEKARSEDPGLPAKIDAVPGLISLSASAYTDAGLQMMAQGIRDYLPQLRMAVRAVLVRLLSSGYMDSGVPAMQEFCASMGISVPQRRQVAQIQVTMNVTLPEDVQPDDSTHLGCETRTQLGREISSWLVRTGQVDQFRAMPDPDVRDIYITQQFA